MSEIRLKCSCGALQGHIVSHAKAGNRLVCYCDDCQAFAQHLEQTKETLDECGGTDIYQMNPSEIKLTQGTEHLRSIRLSPNGLIRLYAGCCNTPIGNTLSGYVPFIGVIHTCIEDMDKLGPIRQHVQGKYALKQPNVGQKVYKSYPIGTMFYFLFKILASKLTPKKAVISPFFDTSGHPRSEPELAPKRS